MREKLIEFICSVEYGKGSLMGNNFQKGFIEKIADHLIANGVTIPVRCKECKGWCSEEIAKHYGVDRYCTMTMMPTNADDYCSYGERRSDG